MADAVASRPFRFGVYMTDAISRKDLVDKCRRAEAYGYDVIGVADHLNMWAPFPSIMLAAEVTHRPRLATAMLDTSFYNPPLLARDVAAIDQLTEGRLEVGLGTGYMKAEFDSAGLPWMSAKQRVEHLEHTVAELRRLLVDPDHRPRPVQDPGPPLWMGGRGDRVLAAAAREADIIGFTGFARSKDGDKGDLEDFDGVEERVKYVRSLLGERIDTVELNVLVWRVFRSSNRRAEAARIGPARSLTADQLLDVPTVLIGTAPQIAEQLLEFRERLGITFFLVRDYSLDDFGPVIEHVR